MDLVFATNNNHKLIEARQVLGGNHKILSLNDINCDIEIPEDFDTLEENATQKAQFIHNKFGFNCFADDTGLEVYALNMKPGVFSARYAGIDCNSQNNIKKLLQELKSSNNRKARFRTIITLILEKEILSFEGIVNGKIIEEFRGKEGFGYDPVFIPEGYNQTFAEMPPSLKNNISHRANALNKLSKFLSLHY
ncbi:MAG TPA: non-canonical purine NTP diphosphatase [Bacteroidales bacterium]|nr:non-canonical purine NTP diphosphatase [Bacteroidales bacterium]MDD4236727.1 non-canonical purine NTP diphosphatase [Bacteroidales bacterium]HXK81005.1 non-canonical purine NTP diphosphatase [Bacteroidales bacterium]